MNTLVPSVFQEIALILYFMGGLLIVSMFIIQMWLKRIAIQLGWTPPISVELVESDTLELPTLEKCECLDINLNIGQRCPRCGLSKP